MNKLWHILLEKNRISLNKEYEILRRHLPVRFSNMI